MSITVNWSPVSGATGYTLYRSANVPVNLSALPADAVTVAADKTSYDYTTFVNNTLYYVVIAVTKADGTVTYSDQTPIGYYPDTGPGPLTLLRGDYTFGYFGEVPSGELFSTSDIYRQLYSQFTGASITPINNPVYTVYHKCIVAGRVVFIPDNTYTSSTIPYSTLVSNKLIVPDGDYANKGLRITRNGYEFIVRAPHATSGPLGVMLGGSAGAITPDIYSSELGMIFALFGVSPPAIPPLPGTSPCCKFKMNDVVVSSWMNLILTDTLQITTTNAITASSVNTGTTAASTITSGIARPLLILEYMF